MLSERMRARLAELNREALPPSREVKPPATARPRKPQADRPAAILPVEKTTGCEAQTPEGAHWLIERPIASMWAESEELVARANSRFKQADSRPGVDADWQQFIEHFPRGTAFLDLETCGFAGSMVFLVGLIHDGPDGLTLSQFLARNYAEERAMLCSLWQRMQACQVLLTFNGKSFDWPMVVDRSVLHRLQDARTCPAPNLHLDLLHHARRRYRRELPNCKLQTLEWYLCGRRRTGDIPGSEIPDVYHDYVRTGDDTQMQSVLHHNALDLITLLQISLRFAHS